MLKLDKKYYRPEEYLALEEEAEYKSEYYDGEIFAMAGSSEKHNTITTNLAAFLHQALRKKACRVYMNDMRVLVKENGLYTYPDVSVICGKPKFLEGKTATLINPTLIVEVLSDSTADYDRGTKFMLYRGLDSLQDYVLVSQNKVHIEYYRKVADGNWLLEELDNIDQKLKAESIQVEIPLREVYFNVRDSSGN